VTLRVGDVHRGIFGTGLDWLGVTRILLSDSGSKIHFAVLWWRSMPRFLWWLCLNTSDGPEGFLDRIRGAESIHVTPVRSVKEVEVRYR